jgi:hypothetical protein
MCLSRIWEALNNASAGAAVGVLLGTIGAVAAVLLSTGSWLYGVVLIELCDDVRIEQRFPRAAGVAGVQISILGKADLLSQRLAYRVVRLVRGEVRLTAHQRSGQLTVIPGVPVANVFEPSPELHSGVRNAAALSK